MADLTVDTTNLNYITRRQQFADIVAFYAPKLKLYFTLDEAHQETWRQSDPFLRDLLQFARKVEERKGDTL